MNEIIVSVEQKQGLVTANFEEVKNQLFIQMENYRGIVYTDETVNVAKSDIATLRKVRKAIEDKRKEVKKAQMIPYEEFEAKAKELVEIIDDVINPITEQISVFEEKRKQERLDGMKKYFSDSITGLEKYISFDDIFTNSMLNVSTSAKSIKETFDAAIENCKKDVETILSMKSEIEEKVLDKYAECKTLSICINMITDHEKMKAEIIARQEMERKAQEERRLAEEKTRAEIEAKMREEAKQKEMQEAIEKAKEEERKKIEQELALQRAKEEEEKRIKEEAERIEREKQEEIEREMIAKEEAERKEIERIEEEKRIAEEKAREEARKKNQLYKVTITNLKKDKLTELGEYLKSNSYSFSSDYQN